LAAELLLQFMHNLLFTGQMITGRFKLTLGRCKFKLAHFFLLNPVVQNLVQLETFFYIHGEITSASQAPALVFENRLHV
jgi:hypothetical protein